MIYGDNDEKKAVPNFNVIMQSINLYSYCSGDPIHIIDPSGSFGEVAISIVTNKNIQRKIWREGAQKLLREQMGYTTSAWLLEHSLQDKPSDVYRGNDSHIAELIKDDSTFNVVINDLMNEIDADYAGSELFWARQSVAFNSGDLYYAIHNCTIAFESEKRADGSWIIDCKMTDVYDYTEISLSMGNLLGTIANDAAVVSSNFGAINPYNITVEFQVRWLR